MPSKPRKSSSSETESSSSEEDILIRKPPRKSEKKPQGSEEKKTTEMVKHHLKLDDLSNIVNEYSSSFKARLSYSITIVGYTIRDALWLDNGNIMALLLDRKTSLLNLSIYKEGRLISRKVLDNKPSKGTYLGELDITPRRNITVSLSEVEKAKKIYYCNQKGKVLWKKSFKSGERKLCTLNDDSVLLRIDGEIIKRTADEEEKLGIKTDGEFIPYGERGFILVSYERVYLYNDNMKRKEIELDNTYNITAIRPIGKNILFGTEKGSLICYNTKKKKEVVSITFDDLPYIKEIHMLSHNKCLVMCAEGEEDGTRNIKIINLSDLDEEPELDYDSYDDLKYLGSLSNGNVLIYNNVYYEEDSYDEEKNIIIYNILKNKYKKINLDWDDENGLDNTKFVGISPNDTLLALDHKGIIYVWR